MPGACGVMPDGRFSSNPRLDFNSNLRYHIKVRETTMRNAIAKDLKTPKYRQRIVASKTAYKRKEKHQKISRFSLDNISR